MPADTSSPQSGQPQSGSGGQKPPLHSLDPTKHLTSKHAPADPGSPTDPNQEALDKQAAQARSAADQQTLAKLQGIYVYTHKTDPGCLFPYEGICLRCGWATLELSEDAAKALVNAHIAQHWRDAVVGITMQGGSGLTGLAGADVQLRREAMQAQEAGAAKGGADALKPVQQKAQQEQQKIDQINAQLAASAASNPPSSSSGGAAGGSQSHP